MSATNAEAKAAVSRSEVLTASEAAEFLRISEEELLQMAADDALPARRIGQDWRFLKTAIENWLGAWEAKAQGADSDTMANHIEFPRLELWNGLRNVVQFPVVVNGKPIQCSIAYETLATRFDARGTPDKATALDAFKFYRTSIESLTREYVESCHFDAGKEIIISSDYVSSRKPGVFFPNTEAWNCDNNVVQFPAEVNGKTIQCRISFEALWTRFGVRGEPDEAKAILAFKSNRASIECFASLLIEEQKPKKNDILCIKSGDVLVSEFAGIWKNDLSVDQNIKSRKRKK